MVIVCIRLRNKSSLALCFFNVFLSQLKEFFKNVRYTVFCKIYGFIGQNGAGKTTFLRLVTGLAFPTSGTLSLWGKSETVELQKQRKRIGSMIETPALFPAMTAYQNMEIQRIQRGIPDKTVIKRTLDMVGLNDTGKKRVRNFSLGMRQRLGIAMALLNTPEFLILDEPVNGLDPAGIVEVRNLLKMLNR